MKLSKTLLFTAPASLSTCAIAGGNTDDQSPTNPQAMVQSGGDSPWMLRLRAIDIMPDAPSSTITVIGGKADDISDEIVPELAVNYFFTDHIATELVLTTARHDVKAKGTSLGTVDLGSVNILPPTLTAVYHFLPKHTVDPYIGAGINYTHFYNVSSGSTANSIDYDDTWGSALQAGVDFQVSPHFYINADVKKVYVEPDVTVKALSQTLKSDVKINPWLVGLGVGHRF